MLIQKISSIETNPFSNTSGMTNAEINIDSPEENINAAVLLAQQACRNINIFSQDLDSAIYDNVEFAKAVALLALRDSRTIIRILVHDSIPAVRTEHRLLKLAQTMPGSVFIRNPSRRYQHIRSSYMVADCLGYLYREKTHKGNYDASVNFMSPERATVLDDEFMETWGQSTIDRNVRRLWL